MRRISIDLVVPKFNSAIFFCFDFVRDHVNNACLRDILLRSGSRHLVDTCTWLIVAHRTHIKPFGRETESLSEWKRVVIHVSLVLGQFFSGGRWLHLSKHSPTWCEKGRQIEELFKDLVVPK